MCVSFKEAWREYGVINLRHRRWMEVTVFTPVCLFVCLFVCEQYYGKTPRRISTKLGGGVRYGPRIMPLDFGLGPKSNMAAMAAILKKYLNFFFFAFLHVLSDFQTTTTKKCWRKIKRKILQLYFKKISILFEKYLNFFFAFLHVLSDFQLPPPPPKKIVRGKKNLQLLF